MTRQHTRRARRASLLRAREKKGKKENATKSTEWPSLRSVIIPLISSPRLFLSLSFERRKKRPSPSRARARSAKKYHSYENLMGRKLRTAVEEGKKRRSRKRGARVHASIEASSSSLDYIRMYARTRVSRGSFHKVFARVRIRGGISVAVLYTYIACRVDR